MLVDDFIGRTSTKERCNDTNENQVIPATKPMAQWALHSQKRNKSFDLEDREDGNEKMVGGRSGNDQCSCGEVEASGQMKLLPEWFRSSGCVGLGTPKLQRPNTETRKTQRRNLKPQTRNLRINIEPVTSYHNPL